MKMMKIVTGIESAIRLLECALFSGYKVPIWSSSSGPGGVHRARSQMSYDAAHQSIEH